MKKIKFKIKTESNLFIGGMPSPFEIGGIDQCTVTEQGELPYIPGSSLKGALRNIVSEEEAHANSIQYRDEIEEIKRLYVSYIKNLENANKEHINSLEQEAKERIQKRYEKACNHVSAQYLFGIEGFNNSPKLIFNDLHLCSLRDSKDYFSIDMKNSITFDEKEGHPKSNPRTYKVAKKGLVFEGTIQLYKIHVLSEDAIGLCTAFIKESLEKFNDGIYRLGNSKSRGYGKVTISFRDENSEESQQ